MAEDQNDAPDNALTGEDSPHEDAPQLSEVEQLASEMGWRPRDKFNEAEGAKFKSAAEFIRGTPSMKDMKRELSSVKRSLERLSSTAASQTDRMLKEQQEQIEARFAESVENKDTAGAAKAVRDLQDLQQTAKPSGKTPDQLFMERNTWYGKDQDASDYAISVSQRLARQGLEGDEMFEEVEKVVGKRFPELFDAPAKPQPPARQPAVSPPSRGRDGAPRTKGFNDMPPEARRAAEDLVGMAKLRFPNKDPEVIRKQYAADYWQNANA